MNKLCLFLQEISQKVSDRALDIVNVRGSPAFWDRVSAQFIYAITPTNWISSNNGILFTEFE